MKKFSLLIALTLLAGSIVLTPSTANAQDDKQTEFDRVWYETCYQKKDTEKCYQLSKEMVEKYSKDQYIPNAQKNIKAYDQAKAWEKFQAALKAYNPPNTPDAAKLEQIFATGEDYLKFDPGQHYVIGPMSLAGANGAMGQFYKNFDKVKGYGEIALKAFETTTPPKDWKPEDWPPYRDFVLAQMNQYLGWMLIETKGDQEQALNYLTKATQVRGKDGAGWKDPNNYWLRSTIYSSRYTEMRKPYEAMTDDQKNGDAGKEVLKKVNELLDTKLIPEYARVLATATKPEAKPLYDAAKSSFNDFWKYRTDAPDKADAYVKNYVADPTIATVAIPAKAETADNSNAPTAPVAGAANPKLSSSGPTAAPGAGGKSASNGNGAKSAPTKGKAAKGGSKSRKRRG